MKKLLTIVLAALMMFTLVAPASAATIPDEVVEKVSTIIPSEITEKVNGFAAFMASIKDFVHKIVGTITQFFKSECPFCDGTHLTGTPSARVEVLEGDYSVNVEGIDYVLDIAYNFTPAEITKDAEKFAYWHADFVITTSKDVDNLLLAGQYDAFDDDYVGLFVDLEAGEEVRLIETYDEKFINKDITVNCKELFENVKSFNCGIYNGEEDNIGATITVELRLYETMDPADTEHNTTNIETGRWVTVATVPCTIMAA